VRSSRRWAGPRAGSRIRIVVGGDAEMRVQIAAKSVSANRASSSIQWFRDTNRNAVLQRSAGGCVRAGAPGRARGGERVDWTFTFTATLYNIVRLRTLLARTV
jgi:hypothetical protein